MILVTGGCGFIGANFILNWLNAHDEPVLNVDALTYAANPDNLSTVIKKDKRYLFVCGSIANRALITQLLANYQPRAIINFAAESHVDRSIHTPEKFIKTNIEGTFQLLEAVREYWLKLRSDAKAKFRFLHISTDEVYGSLNTGDSAFTEKKNYEPNSPYAASKAASDHLVRAWHHTYGIPVLTTNCSNNYGPFQFPEKLIPLMITNALAGKPLPLYGDGKNIRDWLYVIDHCRALECVLALGQIGSTYNIGGHNEMTNLEIVNTICQLLDEFQPTGRGSYQRLITFIADRPGHDKRYAINTQKIENELGWKPVETFASGIRKTVEWYLSNTQWLNNVVSGHYQEWFQRHYAYQQKEVSL
ncbi:MULTISPECIES: dTDP-glucose 4,6-dehydratase [Legionella]|uniref:dTDP-glucose 4,6-dehydratase n=1 Tax=Legionella maceachernii TaxID=466 RepID=A0A0W0WGI5_9GAMM|nr:dTDP-glucose 4,6-dehydratase [Legionella maceachernii]KTD31408.1 dTDP-D-glucose 4,6-dehydratase [Legionella maceachernii]SKA23247.1 dTDP-glucose 4,6-dehydratase [Legionella maceachernii]SUQ35551.1 dTDP-glucose 4,6-dehydratase [Legionella maceachernii]